MKHKKDNRREMPMSRHKEFVDGMYESFPRLPPHEEMSGDKIGQAEYHTKGDTRRILARDYADRHVQSLANETEYSYYAIPGFDIDPIGEQTPNARLARAGQVPYAEKPMSDGSMNYLAATMDMARDDAKKLVRSKEKVYE